MRTSWSADRPDRRRQIDGCAPRSEYTAQHRRRGARRSSRPHLPRLSRTHHDAAIGSRLSGLLERRAARSTAALRHLRRYARGLAHRRSLVGLLHALSPAGCDHHAHAIGGPVRRDAPRGDPRTQVRWLPITGRTARHAHAGPCRIGPEGRRRRRASTAPRGATPCPRLQPGHGPGSEARPPSRPCLEQDTSHATTGRVARRATSQQREIRVRANTRDHAVARCRRRSRGRCLHDGRHARRVRSSAAEWRGYRSAGDYSRASRSFTALNTALAMSSFEPSPFTRSQPARAES